MKKILILLSSLLSSTGLLKAAIYDTFEHDGLRYMIISEGDYYDYDEDPPLVVVTWQVEPVIVTGFPIGYVIVNYYRNMTENYKGLESVEIPGSVEHAGKTYLVKGIDAYAFHGCTTLTEVTINNAISKYDPATGNYEGDFYEIGPGAFIETGLPSLILPRGKYTIGYDCFLNTPLESFTSHGFIIMGSQSFACTNLRRIVLDENIEVQGANVFAMCEDLKLVSIKASYRSQLSASNFQGCSNLEKFIVEENNTSYSAIDGVLFNKNQSKLLAFPGGRTGSYTIPDGVKEIGADAFSFNTNLESITIPASVESMGHGAISACDSLKRLIVMNPAPLVFEQNDAYFWLMDKSTCKLYVPIGSAEAYREAFVWKDFTNIIEFNPENPGDVNVDGKMNVSDVTSLINMILGVTTMDDFIGDVNNDGKVNVSDVTALINLILGIK